jgi:hydroxymethylglutaryl-CoA lyase
MTKITIVESPRLAWEGMRMPLSRKLQTEYLSLVLQAGLTELDAFGFSLSRRMPQMSHSEEVLKKLDLPEGTHATAMVFNASGADRAIAAKGITTLAFPYSLSAIHLRQRNGQSPEENSEDLEAVSGKAQDGERELIAHIAMAFGNPFGDPWDEDELLQGIDNVLETGAKAVVLEDSAALADDASLPELLRKIYTRFGDKLDLGLCLYAEPKEFAATVLMAFDAGCRRFHTALGGVGRPPNAQQSARRLIATEAVFEALQLRECELPAIKSLEEARTMARSLDENCR